MIYAFTGQKVEKLGDLPAVIERAKSLLHPIPGDKMWLPYLGETLDSGIATLFAEEAIEGVRFARGTEPQVIKLEQAREDKARFTGGDLGVHGDKMKLNGPIDDIQLRAWGIQLVDGRMPGFCAIVGCAKSNEVAVKIVRELQSRGILIFLSGNVNGRSIIHQLQEEGIQLGYDTFTVPFGIDTISAVYALGFAARSALTFGGMDAGNARKIMLYNKYRVFAFVLALGEVDDLKYATAAGAISFGFPTIADTRIPQILPDRRDHLRARREHAVRRDPRRRRHGAHGEAHPALHGGPRRQGASIAKVPIPVELRIGLRGRAHPQGHHVRRVRRQALQRVRVPAHEAGRRGRGRQDHRERHRPRRASRRAAPGRSAWSSTSPGARCRPTSSPSSSASSTTSSTASRASSTTASATSPGRASARTPSARASVWSTSAR